MSNIINLEKKRISYLEKLVKEIEKLGMEASRNMGTGTFTHSDFETYELERKIDKLKAMVERAEALESVGVIMGQRYELTRGIYFNVGIVEDSLVAGFCLDGDMDGILYDYFIHSSSGINEWIEKVVCDEYDVLSGNSDYCHCFNTVTMKELMNRITSPESKKEAAIAAATGIVEFTKEDGKYATLRKHCCAVIDSRFDKMMKIVEEEMKK